MTTLGKYQARMATGRYTFPVVILVCLLVRGVTLGGWQDAISLATWALTAYLLIEMNTSFSLIRTRTTFHVSLFLLLSTACPFLYPLQPAIFAAPAFLLSLSMLFRSYESRRPEGSVYRSFFFLGLGSLAFPQLLFFVPVLYVGMGKFGSLSVKSFFAGLLGLMTPYWFLLGHAFFHDEMALFYRPFIQLTSFQPAFSQPLDLEQLLSAALVTLLTLLGSIHYLSTVFMDKVRTRTFLSFLVGVEVCLYLLAIWQPQHFNALLQMQIIFCALFLGRLFVLTRNRMTAISFTVASVLFVAFSLYQLWTRLYNF